MDDVKCLLQLRFSMAPLCARLSLTSAKHNAPEVTGYFLKFPGKNTCRSESLNSFPKVTYRLPPGFQKEVSKFPNGLSPPTWRFREREAGMRPWRQA